MKIEWDELKLYGDINKTKYSLEDDVTRNDGSWRFNYKCGDKLNTFTYQELYTLCKIFARNFEGYTE